jgi:hypothetical protein
MALGIVSFISGLLLIFVVAPLLTSDATSEASLPIDVTPQADLKRRRLVIYENLHDLEFEYKAGKIAPEDYDGLRTNYRVEAAALMAASLEAESPAGEDTLIEREVAARRVKGQRASVPEYICAQCGYANPLPVKFCGECGTALKPRPSKRAR